MTTMELLETIGYIPDSYIIEAENAGHFKNHPQERNEKEPFSVSYGNKKQELYVVRQGQKRKKHPFRKLLLVPATAALLFMALSGQGLSGRWTEYFSSILEKDHYQQQYAQPTSDPTEPTETFVESTAVSSSVEAYHKIIEGTGSFRMENQEMTLQEYCESFTDTLAAQIEYVSMIDMDQNGTPELLLSVALGENSNVGTLVLHQENGEVLGDFYYYRQMFLIKADGTFTASDSAAKYSIQRLVLRGNHWDYQELVWSEINADMEQTEHIADQIKYYAEGKEITAENFDAILTAQNLKTDIQWTPFAEASKSDLWAVE